MFKKSLARIFINVLTEDQLFLASVQIIEWKSRPLQNYLLAINNCSQECNNLFGNWIRGVTAGTWGFVWPSACHVEDVR